jgi:hypothetical protein
MGRFRLKAQVFHQPLKSFGRDDLETRQRVYIGVPEAGFDSSVQGDR